MTLTQAASAKTYLLGFGVLLVNLLGLAFLTSLEALFAYALAFANAAVTWLVATKFERYEFTRGQLE